MLQISCRNYDHTYLVVHDNRYHSLSANNLTWDKAIGDNRAVTRGVPEADFAPPDSPETVLDFERIGRSGEQISPARSVFGRMVLSWLKLRRAREGLSNPVANESVVLMIMQTLRHLHPSPRSPHLRRIHRFSLPPSRFGVFG
jgi:hypothetical protein